LSSLLERNINVKKFSCSVMVLVALTACSKTDGSHIATTVVPDLDHVLTVDDFLAQPAVRQKVSAFCSNDPGRTRLDPNCVNVQRADRIAAAGKGGFPRVVP
jgi:hypothetical protein